MRKKQEKISGKRLAVQILAIVLAVLMVVGIAYYTIFMIVEASKEKAAKEKQEQTDTSGSNDQNHPTTGGTDSGANDNTLPDDAADDIFS